jgi:exopolysaccharide biosynthesis polyprenyl glycosylphosphotransferase
MNRNTLLRIILDLVLIPLIITFAYTLKFKIGWISLHVFNLPFGEIIPHAQVEDYLQASWFICLVWILTFFITGVYSPKTGLMPIVDEAISVIFGSTLAILEIMALSLIYSPFPSSRYVLFYTWLFGIITLIGLRVLLHHLESKAHQSGTHLKKTLIIGANSQGQDLAERMILAPSLGLFYIGTLDYQPPEYCHFHLRNRLTLLGTPEEFESLITQHPIETVIVTLELPSPLLTRIIHLCEKHHITFKLLSQTHEHLPGLCQTEDFDGMTLISTFSSPPWRMGLYGKRLFDILFSLGALLLLCPLFLVIAVLIKKSSPTGPIFYAQERVGKDQRPFMMLKFRTMIPDAEAQSGPAMVNENQETRYIPYGQFLRKTSLDELPQLLNILKGEMSVVGPRPERAFFIDQFSKTIPYFRMRHLMKGGLTGWAQINGRSVLTRKPEHKLRYDMYYIQNWSFIFDIKIIIKTFFVVLKREEAY